MGYVSSGIRKDAKKISLFEHIGIDLMIEDPLTKSLPPKTFIDHVKNMVIMDKSLLTL